jgi:radical SAM/Cys-rich protein
VKGQSLLRARSPLAAADEQKRVLESNGSTRLRFEQALASSGLFPLTPTHIEILQINVGKLCNQTCGHCHVDAGPDRREVMSDEIAELCLQALAATSIGTLDITGGAPELCPAFRKLVMGARALQRRVIDRCNLSVLLLPSQRDLAEFLAQQQVTIVASLPYFQADETDAQRGEGVFDKSIRALQMLNALGYGQPGSDLELNLVYNPVGAFLPPAQAAIEADFKRELRRRHGIEFNQLFTITNMPISRFLEFLLASGNYERYMDRLVNAYNPAAARGVMCRNTISVGWDGVLYDCDFNQMLELPLHRDAPQHIRDFDLHALTQRRIAIGQHCFGCTAGAGSSCGGATI